MKNKKDPDKIFLEVYDILKNMIEVDPFMDVVHVWIKFKNSSLNRFNSVIHHVSSLNNYKELNYKLKIALEVTRKAYKIDKSLDHLRYTLRTKVDSDRVGEIIYIDLTNHK